MLSKSLSVAEKLERFLDRDPSAHLRIVTGYASWHGLAWLAERTENRPVDILIGDMSWKRFLSTSGGAKEAYSFVSRDDVRVWQAGKGARVHAKIWMSGDPPGSEIIAGSANLTRQGLYRNFENMAYMVGVEAYTTIRVMFEIFSEAVSADIDIQSLAAVAEKIGSWSG